MRDYLLSVTEDESLVNSILPYLPEHAEEIVYTINDKELKDINMFKKSKDKGRNPRKANPEFYKENTNATSEELAGVTENQGKYPIFIHILGSNNWVISGKHTKSGAAIFSNDPHLSNGVPSFWHVSRIQFADGRYLVGSSPPGIGIYGTWSNNYVSMGVTTVHVDNSDIYEEKIEGDSYWFKGELLPLETREEVILVKGKDPIKFEIKSTHHGPILGDYAVALRAMSSRTPPVFPKGNFSLAWIGMDPSADKSYDSLLKSYKAESVPEILEVLGGIKRDKKSKEVIEPTGFTQNVLFADVHGNIGYTVTGSLVKR